MTRSLLVLIAMGWLMPGAVAADRPNILWITCEDISPNLGCYGDAYAVTPNLDAFAKQAVRYTNAFAPIGVCAPSRSSLITGMYAPSLGSQHMRCQVALPHGVLPFPAYLRQAGYYCTNNVKTDYNFTYPQETWDDSSNTAHWRKRQADKPFFCVFNITVCHESQIRQSATNYQRRTAEAQPGERHDPMRVPLPPYHPDTPEVRQDWARYQDMITAMDKLAGRILQNLADDRLADDTIVFFFSDHGAGMPRSKRWLYDSSTRVPLLVRMPKKFGQPDMATTDRLVSFVDFGPTVLRLAGVTAAPRHFQGTAFLGPQSERPRDFVFGFRDRMDERTDMSRSVRDQRYKYIRNYYAHRPWFRWQHNQYAMQMPTLHVWQQLAGQQKLTGPAAMFMAMQKPYEELYDTVADPWEVTNIVGKREHNATLERLRQAHEQWRREVIDLSFLPEADLRSRFGNRSSYDAAREADCAIDWPWIRDLADTVGTHNPRCLEKFRAGLRDADPAARYWSATGIGALGDKAGAGVEMLVKALGDETPFVRVAAAEAMWHVGQAEKGVPTLLQAMDDPNEHVRLQAIQVLDRVEPKSAVVQAACVKALGDKYEYVRRVAEHATGKAGVP